MPPTDISTLVSNVCLKINALIAVCRPTQFIFRSHRYMEDVLYYHPKEHFLFLFWLEEETQTPPPPNVEKMLP